MGAPNTCPEGLAMQNLRRQAEEEYGRELAEILASSPETSEESPRAFETRASRIVIPQTAPCTRGGFYVHVEKSVRTEDDPVLRFVPRVSGSAYLREFRRTDLVERPYGLEEEISGRVSRMMETPSGGSGSMHSLFCSVCLVFDCKWHGQTTGVSIRPAGFERDPRNAHARAGDVCSDVCVTGESVADLDVWMRQDLERMCDQAQGFACIASQMFHFRHRRRVSCEDIRRSLGTTPRNVKRVLERTLRRKVNRSAFFTPCSHEGRCSAENGCSCVESKTMCETSCLCVGCENFFTGCRCKKLCVVKCRCAAAGRECGAMCRSRKCGNRKMQASEKPTTVVAPSSVAGYGLFAGERIPRDALVIEYLGEIISNGEAERRGSVYDLKGCSYLFNLCFKDGVPVYALDAGILGNGSRFINHSRRQANLHAMVVQVEGVRRIGFYAAREIARDEELFFDYKYSSEQKTRHRIVD